jgi:Mycothiol maleylpyruvate isomerase N-terminal domain
MAWSVNCGVRELSGSTDRTESLFAQTVISAESETPVPSSPGWTLRHLICQVGRALRWAAEIMGTGADVGLDPREAGCRVEGDSDGCVVRRSNAVQHPWNRVARPEVIHGPGAGVTGAPTGARLSPHRLT